MSDYKFFKFKKTVINLCINFYCFLISFFKKFYLKLNILFLYIKNNQIIKVLLLLSFALLTISFANSITLSYT